MGRLKTPQGDIDRSPTLVGALIWRQLSTKQAVSATESNFSLPSTAFSLLSDKHGGGLSTVSVPTRSSLSRSRTAHAPACTLGDRLFLPCKANSCSFPHAHLRRSLILPFIAPSTCFFSDRSSHKIARPIHAAAACSLYLSSHNCRNVPCYSIKASELGFQFHGHRSAKFARLR